MRTDSVEYIARKVQVSFFLNKTVTVVIDRPIGAPHPKHPEILYPINYGFIPGEMAPDGEDLDVYVLGITEPVRIFTGRVIAIVHRKDDVEDKLVVAPEGITYTAEEISKAVKFQEQFYTSTVEMS